MTDIQKAIAAVHYWPIFAPEVAHLVFRIQKGIIYAARGTVLMRIARAAANV